MRKIKIYFPKADITCYATVLEDDFPELADELWEKIAQPMECEAHNTLSTGDYVQCRPIPPYHVPKYVGDQSVRLCKRRHRLVWLVFRYDLWSLHRASAEYGSHHGKSRP